MTLKPLPQSKLSNLVPLLNTGISEMKFLTTPMAVDFIESLSLGYEHQMMDAYVDCLESPKHCIVFSRYNNPWTRDKKIVIQLIYSVPEERGMPEVISQYKLLLDNYAKLHSATSYVAGSWLLRGSRGICKLWKRLGFELQEIIYVKEL